MAYTGPPPSPPHFSPAPKPKPPAPKPAPKAAEEKAEPVAEPPAVEKAEEATRSVVEHLRLQLANAVVGWYSLKVCHWNLAGPRFRDLHLFFDEAASAAYDSVDDLAERLRKLKQPVDLVQLQQLQSTASISSTVEKQNAQQMLEETLSNAETVITELRAASAQAEKENDPGTIDLLGKLVQAHERTAWFARQMLDGKDVG